MKNLKQLKSVSDIFFQRCDELAEDKPWAVCLAMHEYSRNLYPDDPYITFDKDLCPTERLYNVAVNTTKFLDQADKLGHYSITKVKSLEEEVKAKTGKVYGSLWAKLSSEDLTDNAVKILRERLEKNAFDLSMLKGKKALDIGCGSGRYTFALKKLGCDSVTGVDSGDEGLEIARSMLKKENSSDIFFIKQDVLDLSFEDETFDFVFCNGVLHHTEDMERGIREMIRVAKMGAKIWLYLYGDGGIFWYARKKMRLIMKKIPQEYTIRVLDTIGMPGNRFIFCDNWYVPIESHISDEDIRKILDRYGIKKMTRLEKGNSTDLGYLPLYGEEVSRIMWGDGDLRYVLEK